jgi:hypothetical protein
MYCTDIRLRLTSILYSSWNEVNQLLCPRMTWPMYCVCRLELNKTHSLCIFLSMPCRDEDTSHLNPEAVARRKALEEQQRSQGQGQQGQAQGPDASGNGV